MRQSVTRVGLAAVWVLCMALLGGGCVSPSPGDDTGGNGGNGGNDTPGTTGPDANGRYTAEFAMGDLRVSARGSASQTVGDYTVTLTSTGKGWDEATRKITGGVEVTNGSETKTMWHTEVRVSSLTETDPYPDLVFTFVVVVSWYDHGVADYEASTETLSPVMSTSGAYSFNDLDWNYGRSIAPGATTAEIDWVFATPWDWDSGVDWSSTQGHNNWSYLYWDIADGQYHNLQWGKSNVSRHGWNPGTTVDGWVAHTNPQAFDEFCWIYTDEGYEYGPYMCPLQAEPPEKNLNSRELRPAQVWTAPDDMRVAVSAAVALWTWGPPYSPDGTYIFVDSHGVEHDLSADGIRASILLNDLEIWGQDIPYSPSMDPLTKDLQLDVAAGDRLYFQIAPLATVTRDACTYHVQIARDGPYDGRGSAMGFATGRGNISAPNAGDWFGS